VLRSVEAAACSRGRARVLRGECAPTRPRARPRSLAGKCYRLRFIGMMTNAQNFVTSIAGHTTTLIALDGSDIEPLNVSSFNLHNGERHDVVVCADQTPGNYLINATYDLACPLTKGHFIPPGMAQVPACSFFAYLKYVTPVLDVRTHQTAHDTRGTGGGRDAQPLSQYPAFDLNYLSGYQLVKPLRKEPQPEVADETFIVSMGVLGPTSEKPNTRPYSRARWYMDDYSSRRTFKRPLTPLLHTKGACGASQTPVLTPNASSKVIEVVINNLSPTAHVLHMHGMYFDVINYADYKWCYFNETACFFEPAFVAGCPWEDIQFGDPNDKTMDLGTYWGCKYNAKRYNHTRMLDAPLRKDMISIGRRGWAVIRFRVTNPGFWLFHCHMEQHIPAGMMSVFNLLPEQQQPIPRDTPTEGPCPVNWA
jgi:FtsP/CotA-like multicopper oxidase with cupredoxin domain